MKINKLKIIITIIVSVVVFCLTFLIGPFDFFLHGYFANEINVTQINDANLSRYNLALGEYTTSFSPLNRHLTGIEIYIENNPAENTGNLLISIQDAEGNEIESEKIALNTIKENSWHKFYLHKKYTVGNEYVLHITTENTNTFPSLVTTNLPQLVSEISEGNALIVFAYKKSTFIASEKLFLIIVLFSIWAIYISNLFKPCIKKILKNIGIFGLLLTVLGWNYTFNFMDNLNTQFSGFQDDSESIVIGTLKADKIDSYHVTGTEARYGLGNYIDTHGYIDELVRNVYTIRTDENWTSGYANDGTAILIQNNLYNQKVCIVGNHIQFANGETYQILKVTTIEDSIRLDLNSKDINANKNGQIASISFLDTHGDKLPSAYLEPYKSQYGLQGKIFRRMVKSLTLEQAVPFLRLCCSLITASIFILICFLLKKKYNLLVSVCFFITFWLSPWIINFAQNLYWVEFTWFVPMAVGLACSLKVDNRIWRILSYVLSTVSICIKCLCGYEYISTIMVGLIIFLIADLVVALSQKDKKRFIFLLRTIFIMGLMALLGFIIAIIMHAGIKGDGNILLGIKHIIQEDVMRRTSGADLNQFDPVYWPSFNASIWQVCMMYFNFQTEIITGINGNLFPLLSILPIFVFVSDFHSNKKNIGVVTLYAISFFGSISWLVLAKSHSYIHTHINFIIWYFGFIQICIYILLDKVIRIFRKDGSKND